MEITSYLKIIGRYWWIVALTTLVSGGAALAITTMRPATYGVHVRVVAQPASVVSDTRTLIDAAGQISTREVIGTLAEAFTSADVRASALKAAGMDQPQALDYPLEANPLPTTSVIEVTGSGHDPVLLADYVNATVAAGVKYGNNIYRVIELVPMEKATAPTTPISPVPSRDIPLGTGLGLALGILLAFATDYMRTPHRQETGVHIHALPANPALLDLDERFVANGLSRSDYLVGRPQAPGSHPAGSLPPGRQGNDSFPG